MRGENEENFWKKLYEDRMVYLFGTGAITRETPNALNTTHIIG